VKQLITTSSIKCKNRCAREYYYRVELGMDSIGSARALLIGRVWDAIQARLWMPNTNWNAEDAIECGHNDPAWLALNDVDRINIEVLAMGYVEYWRETQASIERLGVKLQFSTPLHNPETGRTTPLWDLAGELDGLARSNNRLLIVEHKSSGMDLSPGSTYWEKLKIDSQCSNYFEGARSLGYEPDAVLYDVVRKPLLKQLLATPIEDRKYTKPTKTEPTTRLYANQREEDETLDEYRQRLIEDVASRPEFYFHRAEVVRLQSEEAEAGGDVWETAQSINQCQRRARWPRNTESCERFTRLCQFWTVCTGSATIDDETKFVHIGPHPELAKEENPDNRCEHCKEFDNDGCHNCGPIAHSKLYGT
jgi:hypothetical protein